MSGIELIPRTTDDRRGAAAWRRRPAAAPGGVRVNPLVRIALCLFLFSLLFEGVELPIPVESTTLTLGLLLLTAGLQPRLFLRRPPAAFWLFFAYLYASAVSAALLGIVGEAMSRLVLQAQLLALCWVVYCLMSEEQPAREGFAALIAGCAVLAVIYLTGIELPTAKSHAGPERLTMGLDPNQMAGCLGLGALALLGLAYEFRKPFFRPPLLAWPVMALVAAPILGTGSRGGLLALGAGLFGFVFTAGSVRARARAVGIVLCGVLLFAGAVLQSEKVRARFAQTVEGGDLTLRELSYPLAVRMIVERPVLGWGPAGNAMELGRRLGHPAYPRMDTHNLLLYILTASGLVGALPFLAATWLCFRSAWKGRAGPYGVLPLAMVLATLAADMSVTGLDWKQHWIVMGFALAAGAATPTDPPPSR